MALLKDLLVPSVCIPGYNHGVGICWPVARIFSKNIVKKMTMCIRGERLRKLPSGYPNGIQRPCIPQSHNKKILQMIII